ncbi:M15 family metallopeptidase [Dactylosporangium sp. NPDC048998]|uniref:M15 family metallopeptidase n=1 Tax=Dactylosporangium sp. NPDC048998 TaxID=3363976 RepID=UPI00371ABF73
MAATLRTSPARRAVAGLLAAACLAPTAGCGGSAGAPVGLDDLRLVHVSYVDFDGATRPGRLVVHRAIAEATLRVFQRLRQARFPIRGMNLIEQYGGSDDASMAADNTSAFNCRNVPGTSHWSNHAFGRAIDVNAVENPYLAAGRG